MLEHFNLSVLFANPHYYDYFHSLKFENETVEFNDAAGQAINCVAIGKFQIQPIEPFVAEFSFYDIAEVNPFQDNEKVRDVEPFKVRCHKEEGVFAFWQEAVWNIPNEEDTPCLLCKDRYVFEIDPLSFCIENQKHNLYYLIENKDLTESARFYYARENMQQLKLKEISSLGITKDMLRTKSGVF